MLIIILSNIIFLHMNILVITIAVIFVLNYLIAIVKLVKESDSWQWLHPDDYWKHDPY